MPSVEQLTEKILYWLVLDPQAQALAERLLTRFHSMVGDLPASADHHHSGPGGLYQHSIEVGLRALQEFEGDILMERKPDGSVDSFRSSRNRPRWQYACFIAGLCHDLGKVFEFNARAGERNWYPLYQPYSDFVRSARTDLAVSWEPDRQHGAHARLSLLVLHHVLSGADLDYLGLSRLVHLTGSILESHSSATDNPLTRIVARADQRSVEQAQPAIAAQPESKVALFLRALQELITNGEMRVNILGAQVYVSAGKAAVVVPLAVSLARERLRARKVVLPPNDHLYNALRNARLVEADNRGYCVRKIKAPGKQGPVSLYALIFPTEKVVPAEILPTLPPMQFEIEAATEHEAASSEREPGVEEISQ